MRYIYSSTNLCLFVININNKENTQKTPCTSTKKNKSMLQQSSLKHIVHFAYITNKINYTFFSPINTYGSIISCSAGPESGCKGEGRHRGDHSCRKSNAEHRTGKYTEPIGERVYANGFSKWPGRMTEKGYECFNFGRIVVVILTVPETLMLIEE